jgi:hypothetical protein
MSGNQYNRLSPASVSPVTTAETVVLTSAGYVYDNPNPYVGGEHVGSGQGVRINGIVYFSTTAAGTTAITVRVRQGSLAGALVGAQITQSVTANTAAVIAFDEIDFSRFPAAEGGGVYVVTVQGVASTGNPGIAEATMVLTAG